MLNREDSVTVRIFNILGKEVAGPIIGHYQAGTHIITQDFSNLPSGIYIYQITNSDTTLTGRMILLK